jgi:hypothetical protein
MHAQLLNDELILARLVSERAGAAAGSKLKLSSKHHLLGFHAGPSDKYVCLLNDQGYPQASLHETILKEVQLMCAFTQEDLEYYSASLYYQKLVQFSDYDGQKPLAQCIVVRVGSRFNLSSILNALSSQLYRRH